MVSSGRPNPERPLIASIEEFQLIVAVRNRVAVTRMVNDQIG